jgi:N-methylhydantoinase B
VNAPGAATEGLDAVTRSVLASALSGIAEEMGSVLIRSSYSSNIKERHDCSSALFDAEGRMVAQAAHIPVHLGALPESVAAVMAAGPDPGDVFILNDPYSGGSHLPDITLVAPMAPWGQILGYTATRAHHNDVGGMRPGSMPATSSEIFQEGLIIPPVRLVCDGRYVSDVLDLILANVRTPFVRRGDLRAQIAANRLGEVRFRELIERKGRRLVMSACDDLLAYTERRTREALQSLPDGEYCASSEMEGDGVTEDDIPIRVRVVIEGDSAIIDFTGTSPAVAGNVNCPFSVTQSACNFAMQVLLAKDIPVSNAGTFAPFRIVAPVGSLVNARWPSAVVAGNVETSQRIADTVLTALSQVADVPAQGQGTMNVLVLGGSNWTYVETLAGGQGAHSRGAGSSGIHVGMTNTLNTPIEALELEYPLRVERYELAYGTGGDGRHRGGDGLVRSIRVLEAAQLSLLTDRRRHAPQGRDGGGAGATGENRLDGTVLSAKVSRDLPAGAVITVQTPGGGGFGPAGPGESDAAHRPSAASHRSTEPTLSGVP